MTRLRAATPWIFLAVALTWSLLLAWTTPPFQVADEDIHLYRADVFTYGPGGLSTRIWEGRRVVLGRIHQSLIDAEAPFQRLKAHPERKVSRADFAAATQRLDARRVDIPIGQALNPILYLPTSAAVAWSRHFGLTVLDTLRLAHVLNALTSITIGFAALMIARQARLAMFAVLLLPMSVALYAGASQDGPLIALAALAAAILSGAMGEDRALRRREVLACALIIALIGMAKAPYALAALLLLAAPAQDRGLKRLTALLALAVPLAWTGWMALSGWAPPAVPGMTTDAAGQAHALLTHPGEVGPLVAETFRIYGKAYAEEFVGMLGWLDTPLPASFYVAAYVMLGLALAAPAAFASGTGRDWRAVRALAPVVVLAAAAGVFAALYVGWTSVGALRIDGVQGRYLLPLAVFLPLALEGPRAALDRGRVGRGLQAGLTVAVLAFPLASLVVTEVALIQRYYQG